MKWTNKGHEFDTIGKKFTDIEQVYIYGCGKLGTRLAEQLSYCDSVTAFIDTRAADYPNGYLGKPVIAPHDFLKMPRKNIMVIIALYDYMHVKRTFIYEGFLDGENIFDYQTFVNVYMYIYYLYRYNKLRFKQFGNRITQICSLSCKNCSQMWDKIKDRKHKNYSDIIASMDKIFEKIDFLDFYTLASGETFLHPELKKIIEYLFANYSEQFGKFRIITNGFFPTLNKEMYQILQNPRIEILWSDYRDALKDERIVNKINENIKLFEDNGVSVIQKNDKWIDFEAGKKRDETSEELKTVFNNCFGRCNLNSENNLMFSCGMAHFIGKYILGIDKLLDFIDLETESNKAVILELQLGYTEKGYAEMCRYCKGHDGANQRTLIAGEQA